MTSQEFSERRADEGGGGWARMVYADGAWGTQSVCDGAQFLKY